MAHLLSIDQCVSAYPENRLNFYTLINPKCEYFLVKNNRSICVALSDSCSKKIGYKNPIDYLGRTDYELKCPAVELANEFIKQDAEIMSQHAFKTYVLITTYTDGQLLMYFYTKEDYQNHIVCNMWNIQKGYLFNYFFESLFLYHRENKNKINHFFEIIDSYPGLGVRESEILFFLMLHESSTDIAHKLFLSKRTVQHYIEVMKFKMNCQSTKQLVQLGLFLFYNRSVPRSIIK